MKFALVHYDVSRIANEPGNKTVMKHFGHMPNIQLLYVAGLLEKLGVELQYYDMVGMGLAEGDVAERLKRFGPDVIGFSVYTSHFHNAKSYASYFKSVLPGALQPGRGLRLRRRGRDGAAGVRAAVGREGEL
jgi:hypothetical protein